MRSRKRLFVAVAVLAGLLLQLVSCDFEPKDVVFYVWEEEEWVDGRHVVCHYDDSLFSHGLPDSSRCYPYTMHNVFCREESGLLGDTISDEDKSQKWYELPQFGITECLIQYKCSVHTPPSHAIRSG